MNMNKRILAASFAAAMCVAGMACKETPPAADNTARNKADRDTNAKTPLDQSESSPDIKITADIRREIMKADNMSTNAQNCKIITDKGVVTLRGPVNSIAEKDRIAAFATSVAGVVRVDNQLEIKSP